MCLFPGCRNGVGVGSQKIALVFLLKRQQSQPLRSWAKQSLKEPPDSGDQAAKFADWVASPAIKSRRCFGSGWWILKGFFMTYFLKKINRDMEIPWAWTHGFGRERLGAIGVGSTIPDCWNVLPSYLLVLFHQLGVHAWLKFHFCFFNLL